MNSTKMRQKRIRIGVCLFYICHRRAQVAAISCHWIDAPKETNDRVSGQKSIGYGRSMRKLEKQVNAEISMIFKIHYFAFNAGLSGVLVLISVFLREYSDASNTEVGSLLMVLPFVHLFAKPFFCALTDRHRKYRLYLIIALLATVIGFGSYTIVPFNRSFFKSHPRVAWHFLGICTLVGYVAYGVSWALADAYASNLSHKTGQSYEKMRLWGSLGWGSAGALVSAASPFLHLPEMVLGFLIFIVSHLIEILAIALWPRKDDFEMGDTYENVNLVQDELEGQAVESKAQNLCSLEEKEETKDSTDLTFTKGDKLDKHINKLIAMAKFEAAKKQRDLEANQKLEADRVKVSKLQFRILTLVAKKHLSMVRYLMIFFVSGVIFNIHWSYFFMHLARLAREDSDTRFSSLSGLCILAQALGESICFALAPKLVRTLGRDVSILVNSATLAIRLFGNGLGIPLVSPYVAVLTESLHGVNYGLFYQLISETALHFALKVDEVIPELRDLKLIEADTNLRIVRTSLRVTMQGLFSGAFDGLGFGLGSFVAGLLLETREFEELWCLTGAAATMLLVGETLRELLALVSSRLSLERSPSVKEKPATRSAHIGIYPTCSHVIGQKSRPSGQMKVEWPK